METGLEQIPIGRFAIATQLIAILPKCLDPAALTATGVPGEVAGLAVSRSGFSSVLDHFGGTWIFSGDFWPGSEAAPEPARQRIQALLQAAKVCDLLLLDAERDLDPALLAALPPERRILARRSTAGNLPDLRNEFRALAAVPARYYLLVTGAQRPGDGLMPLRLLRELGRDDTTIYAEGPMGIWSRLLAPFLGAPLVFAPLHGDADGGPAVARLIRDYGLPHCPPPAALYGIAGSDVAGSRSPRLHNAGYRALGLPYLYLPFSAASFEEIREDLLDPDSLAGLGLQVRGLTVTAPFKEAALAFACDGDEDATASGGANMLVRTAKGWRSGTSDGFGVLAPLRRRGIDPRGRQAAVIGCGGAGRAAAVALRRAGAAVTLVNRDEQRGRATAERLGMPFMALSVFKPARFSLLVHATPAGGKGEPAPFDITPALPATILIEYLYGVQPSLLTTAARARGLAVIDGAEVLADQIYAQFSFLARRQLPEAVSYDTTK